MLAVWCFFLISGFLVSKILYDCYKDRPRDFLVNRFLRIFPTYWAALSIGVILMYTQTDIESQSRFSTFEPTRISQWVRNIFIFGSSDSNVFQWIVKPAGSLAIELNWYLILFIGSFFTKRWLRIFLICMLPIPVILALAVKSPIEIFGAGFPFALGALAYHSKFHSPVILQKLALILLPAFLFLVPHYMGFSAFDNTKPGRWLNFIAVALLLYIAMPWLATEKPAGRLSKLAGELSYPLFLIHFYVAFIIAKVWQFQGETWEMLTTVSALSLLASYLLVIVIERPIGAIRTRIRNNNHSNKSVTDFLPTSQEIQP